MGRPNRIQDPGFHHVFSRGTGGVSFFIDNDDREFFVALLERTERRLRWRVHAYCLMNTHYHVVVETPAGTISAGMQRLNSIYVKAFNERWGRFGTLVASRFGSRLIENEEYLAEACRYVFLNPVKANLSDRASDWPWSGGLSASAMSGL
ncbi:MAG: transposase [Gaiellaceae bacterium]